MPSRMPLKLVWFQKVPNFGDRLNPWLVAGISGRRIESYSTGNVPRQPHLMAAGSILAYANGQSHIWGTGFIAPEIRPQTAPLTIHALRGPLSLETARSMGTCGQEVALGDPALLVPEIYDPRVVRKRQLGMIPHYVDQNHPWIHTCRNAGVLIIDVRDPVKQILKQIKRCEHILSSSLHGLICAEAYGIKTQWVELSDNVQGRGFKYRDHYAACGYPGEQSCAVSAETDPFELMERATLKPPKVGLKALRDAFPDL
ncbi:MAG: polysaccharide pyruvyl transferase family protein [Verrucomicrobia bacterium]|nr:polysaccharide pyruvyl transferase family protein [Verrucomicrobiota bacterium]